MQFTQRSLERFRILYLKRFGEELSREETRRKAEYLLEVFRVVYDTKSVGDFLDNNKEQEQVKLETSKLDYERGQ